MNNLITIPFHQQTITAIEHDGKPYIAMRPIVENLGLDWKSQYVKLTERFNRCVVMITTHDSIGRKQETLCLPITKIAAFLYSINASKVNPNLRDTIIAYQEECDIVLFDHFMNRYQTEHTTLTAMEAAHFVRHPQWRETRDLYAYGFSTQEIADLQGKHVRNVQKMLIRIRAAGIATNPRRIRAAGIDLSPNQQAA